MMSKEELVNATKNVLKATGQGVAETYLQMSPYWKGDLEVKLFQLVQEGVLIRSYNPRTNDHWYQLPEVYDFTQDDSEGIPVLDAVRHYLGAQEGDEFTFFGRHMEEGTGPRTMDEVIEQKSEEYNNWLNENKAGLDAIKALEV
jgi:hypothetical protein